MRVAGIFLMFASIFARDPGPAPCEKAPVEKPSESRRVGKTSRKGPEVSATWFEGSRGFCGPLKGLYAASGKTMLGGVACGTRVKVSHKGKSVIITILDRCAGCGRGIDLSAAAFKRLAPLSRGRILVKIERG